LLLPVLGSARQAARGVKCLANQRQSHTGISLYATEYKGWLPTAGRSFHNPRMTANWSGAVAHYISVPYITEWNYNNIKWPDIRYISVYSTLRNDVKPNILKCPSDDTYNYWKTQSAVSYSWNTGLNGLGRNDSYTFEYVNPLFAYRYGRQRQASIRMPSSTIMTGEKNLQGLYEYTDAQLSTSADFFPRHNESGNILWSDGHATKTKAEYLTADDFDRTK